MDLDVSATRAELCVLEAALDDVATNEPGNGHILTAGDDDVVFADGLVRLLAAEGASFVFARVHFHHDTIVLRRREVDLIAFRLVVRVEILSTDLWCFEFSAGQAPVFFIIVECPVLELFVEV